MALALAVGTEIWPVGSAEVLHAFFSSISHHLEPGGWGSRFPALMYQLYQGELQVGSVETALSELALARRELSGYSPSALVWDIDDLSARSPWGDLEGSSIPSLAHCFYTADGRDLFDVIALALIRLRAVPSGAACIVDSAGVALQAV